MSTLDSLADGTRAAVPLRIAPLVIIGLILLVLSMLAATTFLTATP